ncbi:MAG: HAMP domain-containing protein [Hyphomicrobiaceae bacterium]|nr:HAMP domain-containing protein [Hyphomicrobiaceae bacterium]
MRFLPERIYTRALIIIIAPIVVLQGVVAFVFMERHWQAVTRRLSEATARDVAAIVALYKGYKTYNYNDSLVSLSRDKLNLQLRIEQGASLPSVQPKPFFSLLDETLSNEIRLRVKDTPFWIDTVGDSDFVEIKIKLESSVLSFIAKRSQTYASNSHIFLIWMVVTSMVLLAVAILFLRNQITPILRLAEAADAFGKGRSFPDDFRPRGAREMRQAAEAFIEMRDRITQHVDQRTTMLAGVSHDLRTFLTRFKLELALLDEKPIIKALEQDIQEMQSMLEEYLSFANGSGGEKIVLTPLRELIREVCKKQQVHGIQIEFIQSSQQHKIIVPLKPNAFKRALVNLINNAKGFSSRVVIRLSEASEWVTIDIEDNGPGIPREERENVFHPFYRLDCSRNQNLGNSGLGLAIARDVVRSHGGDIKLETSSMSGLRAVIRIPL